MSSEKRKGPRVPVQVWAADNSGEEFRVWLDDDPSREDAFLYSTRDIGAWGVFLESESPLPVETTMDLSLTLPGDPEPLRLLCRVVRVVRPGDVPGLVPGMGLEFVNLSAEARRRLERFVADVRSE
jgi:uncharacterized protein (TIGR02266 family)